MYCCKCGKEIASGTICNQCLIREISQDDPALAEKETAASDYANESAKNTQNTQRESYSSSSSYNSSSSSYNSSSSSYSSDSSHKVTFESFLPEPENRMYGFKKALSSTIVGFIGFIWTYISLITCLTDPEALVLTFIALPLIIIPLSQGISSIKTFNERKSTCAKPIATLILGINGLGYAITSAFLDFITFLVCVSTI